MVDAAREQGAKLICFAGDILRDDAGLPSPANIVYDLVNLEMVDGLVSWASSLGGSLEHDGIVAFHRRYHPLPMVSITLPMPGIPTVSIDSYQGMLDIIGHLIEFHGHRRLAFIRGPEGHYYAQERYRAYVDALEAHGIPLDPKLVTLPGDFVSSAGAAGMRLLLDERELRPEVDLDAVVTVSDLPALGALQELQDRAIPVPEAIALAGFNDAPEGQVRHAAADLGEVALLRTGTEGRRNAAGAAGWRASARAGSSTGQAQDTPLVWLSAPISSPGSRPLPCGCGPPGRAERRSCLLHSRSLLTARAFSTP